MTELSALGAVIKAALDEEDNTAVFTETEKSKLADINAGATANATNAELRDRSTHTGTQDADTITDGATNKVYTAIEKTKLLSIAAGATINATNAELRDRSTHTGQQLAATISDFANATDARISAQKGQPNGVPSLDSAGLVPASQLPSYVDDVLELAELSEFPVSGESGKIYVANDTGRTYRWSGSGYVEIVASPGSSDSVTEGATNKYFTDERAQDAVGAMVNDSLIYADGGPGLGINLAKANIWTADQSVPAEAYSPAWNGSNAVPTKNDVYDKMEAVSTAAAAANTTGKLEYIVVALSDETTELTTGTAKVIFRMPFAMTLSDVRLSAGEAPIGAGIIVNMKEAGSTVFSTKPGIDAGEKTSVTGTTAVISDPALADDAEIQFDIDQVGSSTGGKGLKATLIGTR